MLISLIIPTLNQETALARTLASAERLQGESNLEILVVDRGTGDGTVEKAQKKARIMKWEGSRADCLNAGARESLGEILLFALPGLEFPQRSLFAIKERMINMEKDGGGFGKNPSEFCDGLFVRRRAFEALGGFPRQAAFEDYEFMKLLRERYDVASIPEMRVTGVNPPPAWARTLYKLGVPAALLKNFA